MKLFLKWDGIQYENYWGLNLHKLNDDQYPNDDKYFFFELISIDRYKYFRIKNKASNKNINIFKDNSFALAHDTRDSDKMLTFIISNDDSIKI